ncbi:zinc-binding dehydrogenase [Sciscionella sediminilitoris]|uniref:zinc-binding dehydrogenase n=1 Tax=Sciscionella sediminilitoris TaxID=1445613 RepID=UPI0004DF7FA3|nr:zinc-binding dehydrogenase [Sciscionella sp. SE31]
MDAVWLREFGPAEMLRIGTAPDPVPEAGQVVVRVSFANITFVETVTRAGQAIGPFARLRPPFVPGNGVGGIVTRLGPGADPDWLGSRVVTATGGTGGYAEEVAVPAAGLIPVPDGLGLDEATALLADGRTANHVAREAGIRKGERVLVLAAAGGVGHLLVQLAAEEGAQVIAAAGGPEKLAMARELGAAQGVDYREPGWARGIGPVDVVFDGVGGELGEAAFTALGEGGRFVPYGGSSGRPAQVPEDAGPTVVPWKVPDPDDMRALSRAALRQAAAGILHPVIGQRFTLAEAAKAHTAIESRATTGKTLLVVG